MNQSIYRWHEEDHGLRRADQGWCIFRFSSDPVLEEGDVPDLHILPIGDDERHFLAVGCDCGARVIQVEPEGGLVIKHSPYDTRPDPSDGRVLGVLGEVQKFMEDNLDEP